MLEPSRRRLVEAENIALDLNADGSRVGDYGEERLVKRKEWRSKKRRRTSSPESLKVLDDRIRLLLEAFDEGGKELSAVKEVHGDVAADLLADELAESGVRDLASVALLGRDRLKRLRRRDLETVDGELGAVDEVPEPCDGEAVLLVRNLHDDGNTLLQRRIDVDRVGERLSIELLDDVLVLELGAVGASDREREERVDVDGEKGAESGGVNTGDVLWLKHEADLDKGRFDVVELHDQGKLRSVRVNVFLHLVLDLSRRRLRNTAALRRLYVDPLNAVDVGNLQR
jgi:hypothetical protein